MEQIKLPKDIRRHICRISVLRLLKFLLLETLSFLLIFFLHERILEEFHIIAYMFFLVVTALAPVLITELPQKLLDRSWRGTVKAIHIKEKSAVYLFNSCSKPYKKLVIILTVETDKGRTIQVNAKEYGIRRSQGFADPNERNVQLHMNDYREGDAVYHFYGLSELFVIGANRPMNVNCVVCGSENPKSSGRCHSCGHTLLHTLLDPSASQDKGVSS